MQQTNNCKILVKLIEPLGKVFCEPEWKIVSDAKLIQATAKIFGVFSYPLFYGTCSTWVYEICAQKKFVCANFEQ